MFGITDIFTYLLGVILIIVLPGPNSLYCLSVSVSHGRVAGLWAMLGILVGDSILMLATALGAGTLLRLYPEVFMVIKLIGGSYLAYLGARILWGAYQQLRRHLRDRATVPMQFAKGVQHNYFYRSLSLSLTNPKAILFFLSFFVQFVDPAYPHAWVSFLALALILQIVSAAYLLTLIFGGKWLAQKFASRLWLSISAMLVVGVLFIGFGVNLWLSKLV